MATVLELAKKVKKGIKLLDKKVPRWRVVLRRHADQFDFYDGDCCVLGTLEHYNALKKLGKTSKHLRRFPQATRRLSLKPREEHDLGFDAPLIWEDDARRNAEMAILSDLWRAEFEK